MTDDERFDRLLEWLRLERERYQTKKWDYAEDDLQHALEGLGEDSWFWQRGVENYIQRVRLFGVTSPNGIQALMKLVATLLSIPEHLMRGGELENIPEPGHTSGEIVQWQDESQAVPGG